MKSREEIMDIPNLPYSSIKEINSRRILEVLLDIRDLLEEKERK